MEMKYKTFGEEYVHQRTNTLFWKNKLVHGWFLYTSSQPFRLEVELLDFDSQLEKQYLRIKFFNALATVEGETSDKALLLETHKFNLNKKILIDFKPTSKKTPITLRIIHRWHTEKSNANFNPGETEQYLTGNSGMLIEPEPKNLPGTFLVEANSGLHADSEEPLFNDLLFKVKITNLNL